MTLLKLGAAYLSHSVGLLSEGIHSFLDLISALISYFTVQEAGKPADEGHPFGHEKIETLSSLFESLLLIVAAIWISVEGVDHLLHPHPVTHEGFGIFVILISTGVSYWIYRHNGDAAEKTASSALHVNSLHFLADVVTSVGVLIGLIILTLTDWLWIDGVIAIAVALYISAITIKQVKKALLELADTRLPPEEIRLIWEILKEKLEHGEAHDLRTRKSGATRHIDFHFVVCGQMTVEASHDVCDEIELKIQSAFPKALVTIHVEPCEKESAQCYPSCPKVQKK